MDYKKHCGYFLANLKSLPAPYVSLDTNRLTLAYFCVAGLDLMNALHEIKDKPALIEWIYSQQVMMPSQSAPGTDDSGAAASSSGGGGGGGFRAAAIFGGPFGASGAPVESAHDSGHIALTYCALAILCILGDDLSRVDRAATLRCVRALQNESGSFHAVEGGESDMRFVYCAAAICTILKDGIHGGGAGGGGGGGEGSSSASWQGMDTAKATAYIVASQAHEGALGMAPGTEAHGGSTYTGLAALSLMGGLDTLPRRADAVRWCVDRQLDGFQGRPNKDADTCYSFWIGASLHILGFDDLCDGEQLRSFALTCQNPKYGGLSKAPQGMPDVLHSYLALAGLSLAGIEPSLAKLEPRLGMTRRAAVAAGLCSG